MFGLYKNEELFKLIAINGTDTKQFYWNFDKCVVMHTRLHFVILTHHVKYLDSFIYTFPFSGTWRGTEFVHGSKHCLPAAQPLFLVQGDIFKEEV